MSQPKLLINSHKLNLIIKRFALQLIEMHGDFSQSAIIGLQPRGVYLAKRITDVITELQPENTLKYGELDHTFFRDDIGRGEIFMPKKSNINFSTENLNIILVDDVLYTGRSVRASIDAMMSFGRPKQVELMVLVDRRFQRELPISPNYVGVVVDSRSTGEHVKVEWTDDQQQVWLLSKKE
jgi:pyrimidine operon attenuation protein/uracil phosphoribosyltransferase